MTNNDGASYEYFGWNVAISGYMLLIGDEGKDDNRWPAYAFVLEGDGFWDEVTRLIPRILIASIYSFCVSVVLYSDRTLFGYY